VTTEVELIGHGEERVKQQVKQMHELAGQVKAQVENLNTEKAKLMQKVIGLRKELNRIIRKVLDYKGPVICDVKLRHGEKIIPKLEFGRPIEDSSPLLPREEFEKNMKFPCLLSNIQFNFCYQIYDLK
jgi:hypothetical protein